MSRHSLLAGRIGCTPLRSTSITVYTDRCWTNATMLLPDSNGMHVTLLFHALDRQLQRADVIMAPLIYIYMYIPHLPF